MWQYRERLTKIVIENEKSKKENTAEQNAYGPFDESSTKDNAVQSYVVYNFTDKTWTGYLQGEGGIKLNSDSSYLFNNLKNVTEIEGLENLDTSGVTTMSYMFNGMSNLQSLDLSHFNTKSVIYMQYMFYNCNNLTSLTFGDNFTASSVTDMSYMFYGCSQLQSLDLSNFNTSSVTNMSFMFDKCSQLQELDLSNFNTSSVENMNGMFYYMSNLTSLTFGNNFNTSSVINMEQMFSGCSQLQELDLSGFNTSKVTDMDWMFSDAKNLSKITYGPNFIHRIGASVNYMFSNCQANRPNASVHSSWGNVFS